MRVIKLETCQNKPLVSIIITTYNYGHYLSEAIESALNQTYKNTEIIVVDDGSLDNPKEIVDNYPVKYVFQEHRGVSSAKNRGISNAHGDFFVCLDADDKFTPKFVEKTLKRALEDSRIGFVYTGSMVWYENLGIRNIWLPDKIHTKYSLFAGWHGPLGSVLVRRKAFDSLNCGFDENLHSFEDLDLCFRLLSNGWKAAPIFEPLHWYRLHKEPVNSEFKSKTLKAEKYLNDKYWFRTPYRHFYGLYTSTIGRINSFLLSPILYLDGLKTKIKIMLLLNNLELSNHEEQRFVQKLAQELSFTIDMLVKWHRNITLQKYYKEKLIVLQSKLNTIIKSICSRNRCLGRI
jgi:glycosyltransferase involved in cell wall biosynthesis